MKSVKKVSKSSDESFSVFLDGNFDEIKAKALIIATGSEPRKAGFKGEDEFFGRGVSIRYL